MMRSNIDAELLFGPKNFHAEFATMDDGRVRARTTLNGKILEAFDQDERWANIALEQKVHDAIANGDVTLNEI